MYPSYNRYEMDYNFHVMDRSAMMTIGSSLLPLPREMRVPNPFPAQPKKNDIHHTQRAML